MNILSSKQVRERFERMSAEEASIFHDEIGSRLLERLELVKINPGKILDVDCGNGLNSQRLSSRYTRAFILGVDGALNMARAVAPKAPLLAAFFRTQKVLASVAEANALPLAPESVDMVFANLFLPWSDNPDAQMSEFVRVLKEESLFVFSCYGPDTLQELRQFEVDLPVFIDMHDLGDAALAAGFSDPVMEMEKIIFRHKNVTTLCHDLERAGLLAAAEIKRLRNHPQAQSIKNLSLTIEVVYGHAWKPESKSGVETFKGVEIRQA